MLPFYLPVLSTLALTLSRLALAFLQPLKPFIAFPQPRPFSATAADSGTKEPLLNTRFLKVAGVKTYLFESSRQLLP